MEPNQTKFQTVDEYFSTLPPDKKKVLTKMRTIIKKAAPEALELISYNIPAYKLNGMLVFYAAWKEHVGLYGASSSILKEFKEELKPYKQSKGTIQFPYNEPLPVSLITKIVKHRVKENIGKAALKNKKAM